MDEILIKFVPTATSLFRVGQTLEKKVVRNIDGWEQILETKETISTSFERAIMLAREFSG